MVDEIKKNLIDCHHIFEDDNNMSIKLMFVDTKSKFDVLT